MYFVLNKSHMFVQFSCQLYESYIHFWATIMVQRASEFGENKLTSA